VPKAKPGAMVGTVPASEAGARHACEIEYVFQTLTLAHEDTPWADDDFKVSEAMATYWTNFVKSGNPNSSGLPDWPPYHGKDGYTIMHLSGRNLAAAPDTVRSRYLFLDARSGLSSAK
jgi:para-nitrobenzyl esterase